MAAETIKSNDERMNNEWALKDALEELFGIEPFDREGCTGWRYYIGSGEDGICSIQKVYEYPDEKCPFWHPVFSINYWETEWNFKQYKWDFKNYFRPRNKTAKNFDEAVEIFHEWFRFRNDDEQMELF